MSLLTIVAIFFAAIAIVTVVILYSCLVAARRYDNALDEIAEKMADETMNRFEEFLNKED